MNSHVRTSRAAATMIVLIGATTLCAQYALDANLRVGGGRVNQTANRLPIQRDLYRVNRETGEMIYDQNSAFAQPRYNPAKPQRPSEADLSYHRPIAARRDFEVDRRTGTFVHNETAAFEAQRYDAYQASGPRPIASASAVNAGAGDITARYKPARRNPPRGAIGQTVSRPVASDTPRPEEYRPERPPAPIPSKPADVEDIKPERYRPPRVRPARDDR